MLFFPLKNDRHLKNPNCIASYNPPIFKGHTHTHTHTHTHMNKKGKGTNNDIQNIKQKIEEHEPFKTGGELKCSGKVGSSCPTSTLLLRSNVTN